MKRGAENYITKDEAHHDELEEEVPSDGFRKADDSVLATRRIRALPRRVGASPSPSPSTNGSGMTDEPPASPKFGAFTGFGSPFNSSTQQPLPPPTPAQPVSFGSSVSFPSSIPTVASTASNTAKTFASFIADSPSSKPAATLLKSPPDEPVDAEDSAALKYFTSLRGLNVSFLTALSLAVEKDPFTDVTTVLDRYKSLRSTVQTEFDHKALDSINALPSAPTIASFSPRGLNSASKIGGLVPMPSTSASPFGFSFPPSSTLGASSGTSTSPVTSTTSTPTLFGTSVPKPSGTSPFGSSSTTPFLFGGASSSTPGSTNNLRGNDKPTSSFGTTQSSSTSSSKPTPFVSFGGFGKPSGGGGSIGNPVGFGFGNPSRTPEDDGSGSSGFKFGGPSDATETGNTEGDEVAPMAEGDRRDDLVNPGLLGSNPHDEEGEGEEQEDTIYSVKLRAFRLKKPEEKGGSGWVELGYGVLRLKKHKETEARRMLLRNSSTGKININFNLYSGLKPSQTKKALTFVGHDDGVSQTYSVRLQSEEQAAKLKDTLEKEIVLVKGGAE